MVRSGQGVNTQPWQRAVGRSFLGTIGTLLILAAILMAATAY